MICHSIYLDAAQQVVSFNNLDIEMGHSIDSFGNRIIKLLWFIDCLTLSLGINVASRYVHPLFLVA